MKRLPRPSPATCREPLGESCECELVEVQKFENVGIAARVRSVSTFTQPLCYYEVTTTLVSEDQVAGADMKFVRRKKMTALRVEFNEAKAWN